MPREFATQVSISSLVREERGIPEAPLVIALHGWGMSERSFARWLRPGIEADDGVSWWIPRGILPGQVESKRIGYGWYVFDGQDQAALKASMSEARSYVAGLVDLARRHLSPRRIVLAGFSQGGYLASYVALTRPDLFAGLVCCCGRPKSEFVDDLAAARGVAVLVQTGAEDRAVTPELIAKGVGPLREAGLDVAEKELRRAAQADAAHGGRHRGVRAVKLRAHNLLCIQGFVGKGYSPEFVDNMTRRRRVARRRDTEVTVLDEPDALCAACPNLKENGCTLGGPEAERGIAVQDRDVMRRLGLVAGAPVQWGEILERIREHVAPDDLDSICGTCPWLPLGHCRDGLARLRASGGSGAP